MAEQPVYLIDIDNYKVIARFDDFANAVSFADDSKYNYHLVTSSAYLYTYGQSELVKLHNNHVKKSGKIKKFTSMAEGITRTWDVILYDDIKSNPTLTSKDKGDSNMAFGADKEEKEDTGKKESSSKKRAVTKKKDAVARKAESKKKPAAKKKTVAKKEVAESTKKPAAKKKAVKKVDDKKATPKTGKKATVASTFREWIVAGLTEQKVLAKVRKAFPDKDFPDSYYKFYYKECIKKGLIEE